MGIFEFVFLLSTFMMKSFLDGVAIYKETILNEPNIKYMIAQAFKIALNIYACLKFYKSYKKGD